MPNEQGLSTDHTTTGWTTLVCIKDVADVLHVTPRTVYRLMATDPDFPKPIRLGTRTCRWRRRDLILYINR